MATHATSLAILDAQGRVVTFVRLDVPEGWQPPEGCTAVPDDELPEGWERAPDNSPVPQSISARQIRLWLVRNGVSLATVEAAINAIPDAVTRESVRVEWEYAPYVERTHAWLVPMAAALGMTESQVDAAFREAAAL
jgi:hypothetical protein